MKKKLSILLAAVMLLGLLAGCSNEPSEVSDATTDTTDDSTTATDTTTDATTDSTDGTTDTTTDTTTVEDTELAEAEIQVFIAASLENSFIELIEMYQAANPNVTVTYNAESSGTLLTQIQEGYECDIFFSAATKQIEDLEAGGQMVEGSRVDLLCNKVALITWKGSGTAVTGFDNIEEAASMALADGSVPVGQYTRQLLVNMGYMESDDPNSITSEQVADALGLEINECSNVSKVKEAVKERSNEIGTVYYSDAYSVIDDVDVLEIADASLTGDIIYPVCRVVNPEADEAQNAAADDFMEFLQSEEALQVFRDNMFIVYGE